jgi:2,3,4,5-tetrahydropyridine-2-carboxylate N-succinyltransferase
MNKTEQKINTAFDNINDREAINVISDDVEQVIENLGAGHLRVCEKKENQWIIHEWIKKAILIYFRLKKMSLIEAGDISFYDKIPLRKWTGEEGVRVVPHALVRKGAYIARNTILMPSYVNIGAYVDEGTLVDTWATVGSCAQVGKNVHLSGGVGLGGVLEPLQARPVVIEDHVFVGSRSIIVEGAVVRKGAVIGAGTLITSSTRIIDATNKGASVYRGEVPENAVVISGSTVKKFPAGEFNIPCALIIGKRSTRTNMKTSLNDCLREYNIS